MEFLDINKIERSLDKVKNNMPSSNFAKPLIDASDTTQSNLPNLIKEIIGKKENTEAVGKDHNLLRTIAERADKVRQQALTLQYTEH